MNPIDPSRKLPEEETPQTPQTPRRSLSKLTALVRATTQPPTTPSQPTTPSSERKTLSDRFFSKKQAQKEESTETSPDIKVEGEEEPAPNVTTRSRSDSILQQLRKLKLRQSAMKTEDCMNQNECSNIAVYLASTTMAGIGQYQPSGVATTLLCTYIKEDPKMFEWLSDFLSCDMVAKDLKSFSLSILLAVNTEDDSQNSEALRKKGSQVFETLYNYFQQSMQAPDALGISPMPAKLINTLQKIKVNIQKLDEDQSNDAKLQVTVWFFAQILNPMIGTIPNLQYGTSRPVFESLKAYLPTATQLPTYQARQEFHFGLDYTKKV